MLGTVLEAESTKCLYCCQTSVFVGGCLVVVVVPAVVVGSERGEGTAVVVVVVVALDADIVIISVDFLKTGGVILTPLGEVVVALLVCFFVVARSSRLF